MEELIYTSAPQGLMPGSSGFCTVEMTDGMPTETMDSLESLSAYDQNPAATINWMHLRIETIRGPRHVLSRVAPLQGEFSGRSNKLASHLCLSPNELPPQGPMLYLGAGGPLKTAWSGNVARLPARTAGGGLRLPSIPRVCQSWAAAVGDAGVAGAVLDRLLSSDRPLYVMRTAAMDALAMTDEMLSLLSGPDRWGITFSTYLHTMPRSAGCQLRWVVEGSPAAAQTQNLGSDAMIDLRHGAAKVLAGAEAAIVEAARRGSPIGGSKTRSTISSGVDAMAAKEVRQSIRSANDLAADEFSPREGRRQTPLPLPPAPTNSSPLKWAMIGAVALMIPLCGVIIFLAARQPVEVAVLDKIKQTQQEQPKAQPKPLPKKEEIAPPVTEKMPDAKAVKPRTKKDKATPRKPENPQGPKSEIKQAKEFAIDLPTSALSLSRNEQTIFEGVDIHDVSMTRAAPSADPSEYTLSEPDPSGVRDIVAASPDGELARLASLVAEHDRVLFAWSPTTKADRAAAFAISHSFLVKDDTHHSTIQFTLARPIKIEAPPVPTRKKEYAVPKWLSADHALSVKASFRSASSPDPAVLPSVNVTPSATPTDPQFKSVNIGSLNDPWIRGATFSAEAVLIGVPGDRKIVFASETKIDGDGIHFLWRDRRDEINAQTSKMNEAELKKKPVDQRLTNASARISLIENWNGGLTCELEFHAKVGERDIVWARTAPSETNSAETGGKSR